MKFYLLICFIGYTILSFYTHLTFLNNKNQGYLCQKEGVIIIIFKIWKSFLGTLATNIAKVMLCEKVNFNFKKIDITPPNLGQHYICKAKRQWTMLLSWTKR